MKNNLFDLLALAFFDALLKILHSLTSPALMDKTRVRPFRYSRRRNFPHTGGPCVSLPGII